MCSEENMGFLRVKNASNQRNIETTKQEICSRENRGLRSKPVGQISVTE